MYLLIVLTILSLSAAYVGRAVRVQRRHDQRMRSTYAHRVHVNGIRGKSSVTRLIAADFREGGISTVAKTTGTAARLITGHHDEVPVPRKEADIAEQKRVLDASFDQGYAAVVFECMAINPIYQAYLEDKVMQSTIGVITNVREDHTDLLGATLPEIARSLSNTVPRGGHLVTGETDPELLAILRQVCQERGTRLHAVGHQTLDPSVMAGFKHFEYDTNVAIARRVAKLAGIDAATAVRGMHKALPDPGAFMLRKIEQAEKTVHWANLVAINDRESFILTTESLSAQLGEGVKKAVILNNRQDRPERVAQFVDIAVNSVNVDYVFTFGDYEKQVSREVHKHPNGGSVTVIHLGNSTKFRDAEGELLFSRITEAVKEQECLLFGAVNIHTPQSEALLNLLEGNRWSHA